MFSRRTNSPAGTVDAVHIKPQRLNRLPLFQPGQRKDNPSGGGGPENAGARPVQYAGATKAQQQPSWNFEFQDDYLGFAGPSKALDVSGMPANNFRQLGDLYGGRQ